MGVIIFLLILLLIWLIFGQRIKMWLVGFMANRTEDYIRKSMGMPPRPGSKEDRRRQKASQEQAAYAGQSRGDSSKREQSSYGRSASGTSQRRRSYAGGRREPLIPKEYAEDVEFTEIISYSETTIGVSHSDETRTVYHESQVTVVEWTEIKLSK